MSVSIKGTIKQIIAELLSHPDIGSDKVFSCIVKKHYEPRTLNANAYYWKLVHEYAVWSGRSDTYIHNDVLEHYGVDETMDEESGEKITVNIREDIDYHELTEVHLRGTSKFFKGANGKIYRVCVLKRGSHRYDKAEFSRIIDGLIQSIHGSNAPIQTMTPDELARLKGYGYDI